MIQLLSAEEGVTRVVDGGELHHLTQSGWLVLAMIQQDEVTLVDEPIPAPEAQFERTKGRSQYDSTERVLTWKKPVVTTSTKFLVRQSKDSALATMREALDAAQVASRTTHAELHRVRQQNEDGSAEFETLTKTQATTRAELKGSISRQLLAEARARKLELDIARIRTAVGDLRMKEILEGKAS